jgi:hypothetical protein
VAHQQETGRKTDEEGNKKGGDMGFEGEYAQVKNLFM